jgi:adhesin transport system membrane fusion protein
MSNRHQIELLSQSIKLEELSNTALARSTAFSVSLTIMLFIAWASFSEIEESAKAKGEIIPENYVHVVQHVDGGVVKSIHVQEDERVSKGQLLMVLEELGIKEDLAKDSEQKRYLELEIEHIKHLLGISKEKPTLFQDSSNKLFNSRLISDREKLRSSKQILNIKEDLSKKGLISKLSLLESRKEVSDIISQLYQKLSNLDSELTQLKEIIKVENRRINNLSIISPVDGLIKGIQYNTVGSVVPAGVTVMEVVPIGKRMIAEIKISPQDVGFITPKMPVTVKVGSYDFSRYGAIQGEVTSISATTFKDQGDEVYYKGKLTLSKNYVGDQPEENLVLPGMIVDANIVTGKRTIMNYLLKPIRKTIENSFYER